MSPTASRTVTAVRAPEVQALVIELQSVLDALKSPPGDPAPNPNRAGRDRRLLACRAFLLALRLHWIGAVPQLNPAAKPPCSSTH
jgi:hypothetical protein